ncbi:MAG: hypothetical protein ACLFPL_02065 [Candidatus Nanoarchaeia archaeon]
MVNKKGLTGLLAGASMIGLGACSSNLSTQGYAIQPASSGYDIVRVSRNNETGELNQYRVGEVEVSNSGYCTGDIRLGGQRDISGPCPDSLLDQLGDGVVFTGADGNLYTTRAELRAISRPQHDGEGSSGGNTGGGSSGVGNTGGNDGGRRGDSPRG